MRFGYYAWRRSLALTSSALPRIIPLWLAPMPSAASKAIRPLTAWSVDRQTAFPFKIFVQQSALQSWGAQNGRPLSSSEEYAVAKMRLFKAFDDGAVQASPQGRAPYEVAVDENNLEELLGQLGI